MDHIPTIIGIAALIMPCLVFLMVCYAAIRRPGQGSVPPPPPSAPHIPDMPDLPPPAWPHDTPVWLRDDPPYSEMPAWMQGPPPAGWKLGDSIKKANESKRKGSYQDVRRERLRANGGHHTRAEWLALCRQFSGQCLCCRRVQPLTKDHVIPVSAGGSDSISNIQPLCRTCNSQKGTRTVDYRPVRSS